MIDKRITASFLFLLMFFFACEEHITSTCEIEGLEDMNMTPAQFSAIQQNIFNKRCTVCHSGSIPSGGLDLSEGNAYGELINKELVVPRNSGSSILFQRLNSDNPDFQMPPTGKLPQALIDSVAVWIDRGALRN